MFEYSANVVSVYDGDTFHADLDLGFDIWHRNADFRMYGINAPELTASDPVVKAAAFAARDALRVLILGKPVTIQSIKDRTEKYGRYLAIVFVRQADGTLLNVNDYMVQNNFAVPYFP